MTLDIIKQKEEELKQLKISQRDALNEEIKKIKEDYQANIDDIKKEMKNQIAPLQKELIKYNRLAGEKPQNE